MRAGVVAALVVWTTGWLVERLRFGASDATAAARVEAELQRRFDQSTDTLGQVASQVAGERRTIIEQLEKTTGARVELGSFHFGWRLLTARFDGLTLHGREREGTPPLFHADALQFDIRVESFWGRKFSLGNVQMSHFSAHIQIEKDGRTNIPGPKIVVATGRLIA